VRLIGREILYTNINLCATQLQAAMRWHFWKQNASVVEIKHLICHANSANFTRVL